VAPVIVGSSRLPTERGGIKSAVAGEAGQRARRARRLNDVTEPDRLIVEEGGEPLRRVTTPGTGSLLTIR